MDANLSTKLTRPVRDTRAISGITMMRKLVYYAACSLDGFIAREDGSFDFALPDGEHLQDLMRRFPETFPGHLRGTLGVTAPNQCFDTVLMGRATYEWGYQYGLTPGALAYPHMRHYVFSKTLHFDDKK